jgi:hypothetical protein
MRWRLGVLFCAGHQPSLLVAPSKSQTVEREQPLLPPTPCRNRTGSPPPPSAIFSAAGKAAAPAALNSAVLPPLPPPGRRRTALSREAATEYQRAPVASSCCCSGHSAAAASRKPLNSSSAGHMASRWVLLLPSGHVGRGQCQVPPPCALPPAAGGCSWRAADGTAAWAEAACGGCAGADGVASRPNTYSVRSLQRPASREGGVGEAAALWC